MMVLSREADKTISGASEVVAMAVTNKEFVNSEIHIDSRSKANKLTPVTVT
jgi:hypothetical protein